MTSPDPDKLKKLLLILLSADQPGEMAAASAAISRLLKQSGKDIHWLANALAAPQQPEPQPQRAQPQSDRPWLDLFAYCYANSGQLRASDRSLIETLRSKLASNPHWNPSIRQQAWLSDIVDRLRAAGAVW